VTIGGEIGLAIYVFALVLAAITDLCSLRIPNWLTLSLAAAFPPVALLFGHDVHWLSHFAAGFVVFAAAALLFAFGFLGGGDAKLLAATALWAGLGQLLDLLVLTAIAGGLLALVMVLLRHPVAQASFLATLRRLPSFAQKNTPIPYGIPIAVAGILLVPSLGFLT
jgi:prepilin peptidase CpaA